MARKLKSDRVLFIATILLVGLSIVMVYSASAVVALERSGRALSVPDQAGPVGRAWHRRARRRDADRLPDSIATPAFIWSSLALRDARADRGALQPAGERRPAVVRIGGLGGLGVQPSELAKLSAIFFIAALLERRMHRINELGYSLLPIAVVVVSLVGLILLEPDFGTSMSLVADRRGDGVRGRPQLHATSSAPRWRTLPVVAFLVMSASYRRRRISDVSQPVGRPARRRVSDHPVADRRRHRRRVGQGADERRAEAVLPARAAHRFHLFGDFRGARTGWRDRGGGCASA